MSLESAGVLTLRRLAQSNLPKQFQNRMQCGRHALAVTYLISNQNTDKYQQEQ